MLVEKDMSNISLNRQLYLLGINKSSYYYHKQPRLISAEDLHLMNLVDKIYTSFPIFGTRKMCEYLYNEHEMQVNRDKMRGIYDKLQIRAIYQEPKGTVANKAHKKYPYLLKNVAIADVNHVWSTDITYIPYKNGFVYLSAIIDWYSRYVLGWSLDIDMEASNCVELLQNTLNIYDKCLIFNTDQGSQYTSNIFTDCLNSNQIAISMDGRGRWSDNIFIERLWRTVKYECVYLNDFASVSEIRDTLARYFIFYNSKRPHQSLGGRTPQMIYCKS
jgi:putative transposase